MLITIKTTDKTSSAILHGNTRNSTIMYYGTDEKFCLEWDNIIEPFHHCRDIMLFISRSQINTREINEIGHLS